MIFFFAFSFVAVSPSRVRSGNRCTPRIHTRYGRRTILYTTRIITSCGRHGAGPACVKGTHTRPDPGPQGDVAESGEEGKEKRLDYKQTHKRTKTRPVRARAWVYRFLVTVAPPRVDLITWALWVNALCNWEKRFRTDQRTSDCRSRPSLFSLCTELRTLFTSLKLSDKIHIFVFFFPFFQFCIYVRLMILDSFWRPLHL